MPFVPPPSVLLVGRAISLVVVGACPGGTTSQLFSFWAGGDVALSIAMTVFSTGTALFMQPLILFLYMQAIDPDTELKLAIGSLVRFVRFPRASAWACGAGEVFGISRARVCVRHAVCP